MKTCIGCVLCLASLLIPHAESMAQAVGVLTEAPRQRSASQETMQKLSQLGKMLIMYSMDNGEAFPPKLEDAVAAMGMDKNASLWTDPATGKKIPFLYRPGLTAGSGADRMVVAAPAAVSDSREVLFVDGSVLRMQEAEFVKQAAAQKWVVPAAIKKEEVEAGLRAEIELQIKKLGDADAKVRAAARNRLKEIGAPATPFLEEQLKHADPEIRMATKELLGN